MESLVMWIKNKKLINFIIINIKIFNHKYICEIYLIISIFKNIIYIININCKITIIWILFDIIKFWFSN